MRTNPAWMMAAFLTTAALLPTPVHAHIELKKKTVDAYDLYIRVNNERVQKALAEGQPFLWHDTQPPARRAEIEKELRAGTVVIDHVSVRQDGKKLAAPDALIHHWIGVVFIPGATVEQVLALIRDYNEHAAVYKPDVMQSRILEHHGDEYKVFFRFLKKKVLTVVLDSDHEVKYGMLGPKRAVSRSWTTRIAEIEHAGRPSESARPVGNDSGFMWRLDTWWRFEERDGGTYVQCESVSLSRDIPFGLEWLIGPFVKSVPRESLVFTLGTTRSAMMMRLAQMKNTSPFSPSN